MGRPHLLWQIDAGRSATVTVGNLTGTPADLRSADEGTYLTATTSGSVTVTYDLGTAQAVGAVCVAGENLAGLAATVSRSSDGSNWTTITLSAGGTTANQTANAMIFSSPQTYRYFRIVLASAPASARLYHVAVCAGYLWPYLMDGVDLVAMKTDATVLESPSGHLLAIQRNRSSRELEIDFGQVSDTEAGYYAQWVDDCVRQPQGFFFVPDEAVSTCYFGWADLKKTYGMKRRLGLYELSPITMTTRVP